jgi:serine protease inhibitor
MYETFEFVLDKPFLFVIESTETHEPLMMGRIVAPAFDA